MSPQTIAKLRTLRNHWTGADRAQTLDLLAETIPPLLDAVIELARDDEALRALGDEVRGQPGTVPAFVDSPGPSAHRTTSPTRPAAEVMEARSKNQPEIREVRENPGQDADPRDESRPAGQLALGHPMNLTGPPAGEPGDQAEQPATP